MILKDFIHYVILLFYCLHVGDSFIPILRFNQLGHSKSHQQLLDKPSGTDAYEKYRDYSDHGIENDEEVIKMEGMIERAARPESRLRILELDVLITNSESLNPSNDIRCYLVGRTSKFKQRGMFSLSESLVELAELCRTAGLSICGYNTQKLHKPNSRTFIGSGKMSEVKEEVDRLNCTMVVFDDELTPSQQRNIVAALGKVDVVDRTCLILDIFSQHAQSAEGKLQVEVASLTYQLPRLTKMWSHLDRQGSRGMGESQLEVDRRLARDKISALQKKLEKVKSHRELHRHGRRHLGLPVVALVGYTNAGKSTLLNNLSSSNIYAADKLFATLDPTTRRCRLCSLDVLLTDTVGFIQKLPTHLVAAFRATLEEVRQADVVVHVVDASSDAWRKQSTSVESTLRELGVTRPTFTLWNKADKLTSEQLEQRSLLASNFTVLASVKGGQGMARFLEELERLVRETCLVEVEVILPFAKTELLSLCHQQGVVKQQNCEQDGVHLQVSVSLDLANRLKQAAQTSDHRVDI